ncbi:hypothetical protein M427DRAFT_144677 [Gonapodya prolifera JEL478]|uniref:Peroxisomal biogenesis factor 11 n=1 Tax=Gonapodya prolifera (strain JEL478) TaxID=1344416 RepID=A0A139AIR7_GONPJ|nr:hypothetical protein M427DRAFT_144677 [Gonapodya prolifera JEL478]|eukprot:KXS16599.1 hypothetical protein M427DRAFT_144677 [Gonapodya prolifera JEL478]
MSDPNTQIVGTAEIVGHVVPPPRRPTALVLALLLTKKVQSRTDGRDVLLKVPQYLAGTLLYLASQLGVPKPENQGRLNNLKSNFSVARRIIRLGHVVQPLSTVVDVVRDLLKHREEVVKLEHPKSGEDFARLFALFQVFLAIANDVCDDLGTLSSIGVLPSKYAVADYYGVRLWATGNLIDQFETYEATVRLQTRIQILKEKGETKKARDLSGQLFMTRALQVQLFADAVWLATDINPELVGKVLTTFFPEIKPRDHIGGVAAVAGLVSGLIGLHRTYTRALEA